MSRLRFEVTDTHRATEIQQELMSSPAMIEALLKEPWFIALRELSRRWECANYNDDGDPWVEMPKGSHDAEACWKLNRLFPGLLKVDEISFDQARGFNPQELKQCCEIALSSWDWNPRLWEGKTQDANSFVENMKLVFQQMIDNPQDFMDVEEDMRLLDLENHKRGNQIPSIWDYLSERCESFAATWTSQEQQS